MTHLQKLKTLSVLKSVSTNFTDNLLTTSRTVYWCTGSFHIALNPRFYRKKSADQTEKYENPAANSTSNIENVGRIPRATVREAQAALLEYLHSTRGIQFMDAENMSKNSPHFMEKLLKSVEIEGDIGRSISRFLRYHPVNEYEPFFESLGLKPSEYTPLLPKNLMYLSDDYLLLENYCVLCNYGIARCKIGKIYKEAPEIFQYGYGVLLPKLKAYEQLGLSQSTVAKVASCSPYLFIGDVNAEFVRVLEKFTSYGFESNWIEGHMVGKNTYNWSRILGLLYYFHEMGFNEEELGRLINSHPDILFEGSGNRTFSLIGLLLKFGTTTNQIYSMFLQFPQIQVIKFLSNLRRCVLFLNEIDMHTIEIGKIVGSQSILLGSCALKKTNSLLANLNVGKKRLCRLILDNPQVLKNWVMGTKVIPLPKSEEDLRSHEQKIQFLVRWGLVEDPSKIQEALKLFRGRGGELQERFDSIVKAGISEQDVCEMIKVSPQILNLTKEVIETKMDYLVNDLGYPISTLVIFPSYLSYTRQRIKLRLSMYYWLIDQGKAEPGLALSTVVACTENIFVKQYVNQHPNGLQVWEDLKKDIYSE